MLIKYKVLELLYENKYSDYSYLIYIWYFKNDVDLINWINNLVCIK